MRSPVSTTIGQNVLNAMHDSGEHLPIRVKILVVVQAAALCGGRILVRRAAFTNAMRRNIRVIIALHLVYASSTIQARLYS